MSEPINPAESAQIKAIEKEHAESRFAKRLHFEKLYSEWLRLRSLEADPDQDESDAARNASTNRVEQAARLLLSTPAELSWMIHWKVEVMEVWLDREDTKWTDNRVTFALGCIKADLARFLGPDSGVGAGQEDADG